MASGSSRAGEGGEDSTHRTVPQHPAHLGSDPTVCGGGTTRSWPERGRLGDAEAVGHRSRLRKGNFQPKLRLERLEEKLKLLGLEGGREEKTHLCSWRRGTVASEAAAKASGSSRDGPRAGGGPTAAHAEEPAREDEEQTRRDLEKLKKRREELLGVKTSGERRFREFLTRTEAERQKVVSEFRQLRRFLKDQELVLLAGLGELGREATRKREEEETRISGEISLLDVLVCETEKKLEQPPGGFLQDARSSVGRFASRWETGRAGRTETETETFLDLERRLRAVSRQNDVLREALGRFQDALLAELEKEGGAPPGEDGKGEGLGFFLVFFWREGSGKVIFSPKERLKLVGNRGAELALRFLKPGRSSALSSSTEKSIPEREDVEISPLPRGRVTLRLERGWVFLGGGKVTSSPKVTVLLPVPGSVRDSGPRHGQRPAGGVPGSPRGGMEGRGAGSAPHPPALRRLPLPPGPPGLRDGETLVGGGGGRRRRLGPGGGPRLRPQERLAGISTGERDLGPGTLREPVPRLRFPRRRHHLRRRRPPRGKRGEGAGGPGLRRGASGLFPGGGAAPPLYLPKRRFRGGARLPLLLGGERVPPPPLPLSLTPTLLGFFWGGGHTDFLLLPHLLPWRFLMMGRENL
ncbi:uncharacterized protein LOC141735127 isoform X2 [Larus michahellis]|uniref:uncharacterized protein LOC141735127 isoform X2 n=1 Tax=Larus michahellis TaxID=119627 RepID=UPI003D9BE9E2